MPGIIAPTLFTVDIQYQTTFQRATPGHSVLSPWTTSVEVFDVDTQTWESPLSVTDMSIGRNCFAAVVIGRFVVVLGGADSNHNQLSSVEVLDTSTGYWIVFPQKMTSP